MTPKAKKKGGRPRKSKTAEGLFLEIMREKTIGSPPWPDEAACLIARRRAAFAEARGEKSWPAYIRASLPSPYETKDNEDCSLDAELARVERSLAVAAPGLIRELAAFRNLVLERDRIEAKRRDASNAKLAARAIVPLKFGERRVPEVIGAIEGAANLIDLHAQFARLAVEGKTSDDGRGRRRDPARARAARHTIRVGVTDWQPTARDLALVAICEGATALPSDYRNLTVAELIRRETTAMRSYLPKGDGN